MPAPEAPAPAPEAPAPAPEAPAPEEAPAPAQPVAYVDQIQQAIEKQGLDGNIVING
ncbi:hypothetical protein [Mycolicibacterium setense]|uniref:hypothetical protein n=1 Tax=Mycolicibacterium setense TaxID=431269 RepID=UPI00195509A4|nr:hypothetical protein [Mycolicibacterium setense]